MASRKISDLTPEMQQKAVDFLQVAKQRGVDVLIYCTYRSPEEQARLWRQPKSTAQVIRGSELLRTKYGRDDLADILMSVGPQNGPKVTNALPGQSLHNYGLAFDCVPMVGGKLQWSKRCELWQVIGECAELAGLEWAGNWKTFVEFPHVQMPGVNWRNLI